MMTTEITTKDIDPLSDMLQSAFDLIETEANYASDGSDNMRWLLSWYTRKTGEIADSRIRLKAAFEHASRLLDSEEKALFRWEGRLREEADRQFGEGAGGKKKSIRNDYGTVGYRTIAGRVLIAIEDESKAIAEALRVYPQAVRMSIDKTVLKKWLDETGEEFPGTKVEKSESYQKFYIKPEPKMLPR